MLRTVELTKTYRGAIRANDAITLRVAAGEVVGLLGHNGAGKSTLIGQIVGLIRPTSGAIELAGRDPVADPAFARQACSTQLQAQAPLSGVTPAEAIEMIGRLRGGRRPAVRARTRQLLSALDIARWSTTNADDLSGGVRRLTAFCMAVVVPGQLVLLDEPTNDVDPIRRRLLWDQVRSLADSGHGVLVVTHNVAEAERVVDRAVVLDQGRVVAHGTPAELRAGISHSLCLEVTPSTGSALQIEEWASVTPSDAEHRMTLRLLPEDAARAAAWAQAQMAAGAIEQFSINPVSLEDVYVGLTTQTEEAGEDALVA
ncbi:ABC transporter ATP-binding protein [Actinoplanes sp. NPDC048796]|uniref:ABC transporter ATP-binding protein n=1 Tax=Actinoplanes sp. NPDC048796 TaxID=3155640 RepID=UPI003403F0C8